MRVTNRQLIRTSLSAVNDARSRLQQVQNVALSGKRVSAASDDPAAASRARALASLRAAAQSHENNIQNGIARLQTAEASLSSVGNLLLRAKEIALSGANATINGDQREAAAEEVAAIRNSVADLINTKHLDEYVFAHVETRSPPYDTGTSSFTYNVNTFDQVRRVDVGPSQTAEIGASGSMAFAQRGADPASIDVPAMLANLEAQLRANDPDAIRAVVDDVDTAHSQVLSERTQTGVRVQRLRDAEATSTQAQSIYTTLEGDLVDADASEAFSNLTLAETSMRAAVTVSARILGPSLLDVL